MDYLNKAQKGGWVQRWKKAASEGMRKEKNARKSF